MNKYESPTRHSFTVHHIFSLQLLTIWIAHFFYHCISDFPIHIFSLLNFFHKRFQSSFFFPPYSLSSSLSQQYHSFLCISSKFSSVAFPLFHPLLLFIIPFMVWAFEIQRRSKTSSSVWALLHCLTWTATQWNFCSVLLVVLQTMHLALCSVTATNPAIMTTSWPHSHFHSHQVGRSQVPCVVKNIGDHR